MSPETLSGDRRHVCEVTDALKQWNFDFLKFFKVSDHIVKESSMQKTKSDVLALFIRNVGRLNVKE